VSLVLVLVLVITATVFTHWAVISSQEKEELGEKADELLVNLQKSIELPIWNFDNEALDRIVEAYFLSSLVSEIVITGGLTNEIIIKKVSPDDKDLIVREGKVSHQDDIIAHVRIGLTTRLYRERLHRLIGSYFFTALALILMFVFVTGILLRIFLKNPFEKLIHGLERLSAGDYSHRLTQVREKEFTVIVEKIENMADQIKEREKSLNSAKTYISDLFNSIDSILVGVDASGSITHGNSRASQFAGVSIEKEMGRSFIELFPCFSHKFRAITKALETETFYRDLKVKASTDSGTRYFSIAVNPLTSKGERGAVIRINEVSERVRLEEMMIQTEKMLSVGGLAAGMAHEINNPLAGMLQNSQVIENRLSRESLPANVKAAEAVGVPMESIKKFMEHRGILELLGSVRQAGGRAARIVENMLSFSRKSSSGFVLADLRKIVDDTIELAASDYDLKKNYDFKSIEIQKNYDDNLPHIPCDVTKIQQVILNILKNGAQAMAENREENRSPCFVLRISQTTDTEIIEIRDNGPGMDEMTRKRVFEPFYTTKPVGVSTGLGLSVSYFIVIENHKGTMVVETSPGNGTKFQISLPKKQNRQDS